MARFIGQCVIFTIVTFWLILLDGLAVSYLWNSFISTTLEMTKISFIQAMGISMTIRFVTYQYEVGKQKKESVFAERMVESLIFYTVRFCLTMFIAWIINLWM